MYSPPSIRYTILTGLSLSSTLPLKVRGRAVLAGAVQPVAPIRVAAMRARIAIVEQRCIGLSFPVRASRLCVGFFDFDAGASVGGGGGGGRGRPRPRPARGPRRDPSGEPPPRAPHPGHASVSGSPPPRSLRTGYGTLRVGGPIFNKNRRAAVWAQSGWHGHAVPLRGRANGQRAPRPRTSVAVPPTNNLILTRGPRGLRAVWHQRAVCRACSLVAPASMPTACPLAQSSLRPGRANSGPPRQVNWGHAAHRKGCAAGGQRCKLSSASAQAPRRVGALHPPAGLFARDTGGCTASTLRG